MVQFTFNKRDQHRGHNRRPRFSEWIRPLSLQISSKSPETTVMLTKPSKTGPIPGNVLTSTSEISPGWLVWGIFFSFLMHSNFQPSQKKGSRHEEDQEVIILIFRYKSLHRDCPWTDPLDRVPPDREPPSQKEHGTRHRHQFPRRKMGLGTHTVSNIIQTPPLADRMTVTYLWKYYLATNFVCGR